MKIYCIKNDSGYCKLTLGKEYEDLQIQSSDKYVIISDDQYPHSYSKDKFTTDKELAIKILDRNNNPSEYYEPLCISVLITEDEYQTSRVNLNVIHIDNSLLGVGNLYNFLDIKPSYNITLTSSTKYICYNPTSGFLQIGKNEKSNGTSEIYSVNNNQKAIEFAYKVSKSIEEINKTLIYKKKEKKLVYLVEHEPNGKVYYFKSDDKELNNNQTVYCDTSRGLQYGVIKGTKYIPHSQWYQLKECRRIEYNKEIVGYMYSVRGENGITHTFRNKNNTIKIGDFIQGEIKDGFLCGEVIKSESTTNLVKLNKLRVCYKLDKKENE